MAMLVGGGGWEKRSATEVGQRGQSLKLDELVRACSEWHAGPVPPAAGSSSVKLACPGPLRVGRGASPIG